MWIDRLEAQQLNEELMRELDFRFLMRVTMVQCRRMSSGITTFPICPKCDCTFEREYQSFCDRCGQKLDWSGYERAVLVFPGAKVPQFGSRMP